MKNRESLYPGRIKLTPVDAANGIYDLVRADEPQEEGTPLNKALLDYAVAACGVTAGTATALTLDDAFGGFTLVDGAKVNFRLHVASGANPTLNVNGTGAKSILAVNGVPMPLGIPQGTWITATYSAHRDCYLYSAGSSFDVTTIDSNTSAIIVNLPAGASVVRIRVHAQTVSTTGTYPWRITPNISFGNYYTSGVNNGAAIGSSGSGQVIKVAGAVSSKGAYMDIVMTRKNNISTLHAIVGGEKSFSGAVVPPTSGFITQLTIDCESESGTFKAGALIIMEVIA